MASGQVNRANRPNTWPQPTNCTVKKTLASREPSTHGTSRKWRPSHLAAALGSQADSDQTDLNTWPQPTNCTVKKTLASREPSTHGTSRKWRPSHLAAALGSKADSDKPSVGTFILR